jgi:metallophosphoesterase superfamily enzyme
MTDLVVINDLHIGVVRSAGTTPETQLKLREYAIAQLEALLPKDGSNCMILGDLFDSINIPLQDLFKTYKVLSTWLDTHKPSFLYNVMGNHDMAKSSNVTSSFTMLGWLLSSHTNYYHIDRPHLLPYGYVIPHVRNQDLFDVELARVPECNVLFLHCNYDNHFAAQSDQSLNVSYDQVTKLPAKTIFFAHEHHPRKIGNVFIPGNQFATSVSDWLQQTDKTFSVVTQEGEIQSVSWGSKAAAFAEVDWKELASAQPTQHFVRVVGTATSEESAAVVSAIAQFRKSSTAYVVANGVTITGADGMELGNFADTLEAVKGFSIMDSLKTLVTEEEYKILESLC